MGPRSSIDNKDRAMEKKNFCLLYKQYSRRFPSKNPSRDS